MLTCFVCKLSLFSDVKQLFKHFKNAHWIIDQNAKYICCEGSCSRMFNDKYRFGTHLVSFHSDCISASESVASDSLHSNAAITAQLEKVESEEELQSRKRDDCHKPQPKMRKLEVKTVAARYIAECKSRTATLQQATLMAKSCNSLVDFIVSDIADDVEQLTHSATVAQHAVIEKLLEKLNSYSRPFEGLENEYSFKKYLEQSGYYVAPSQYVIGRYTSSQLQSETGYVSASSAESTGQFISVESMIRALHSKTDLISKLISCSTRPVNGHDLSTFCDGLFWRRHALVNENVILIRLYGDDFEPGNPLGSRKTLYKIGTVYFQFESLPSNLNSKLENIFLTLCYHTGDVKLFGWDNVLRPLILELQRLESCGMTLTVNDEIVNFKVVVSCVTGDNLFLNSILGFTESFSSNYPCRHCKLHRNNFQNVHVEQTELIRTAFQYDSDVIANSVKDSGIKFPSPLNVLKYFHAAENFVQDIMHDVLEGICKYDVKLVISHVVKLEGMSLDRLNGLVANFSYGKHDITNKPVSLSEIALKSDMLPLSASQMWCLTRILSLAVGFHVPRDDKIWALYLQLRNVLDIVFAPVISSDELILLGVQIEEYLQMHVDCFPDESLKNKHHHLVHYPRLMREVGPLYPLWCMRFESKHQRSKTVMNMSCNFKNVPLTIATRHQYDVAHRMIASEGIEATETRLGKGEVVMLSHLKNGREINVCMNVGLNFELYHCKSLEMFGTIYSCGCYLLAAIEDEKPLFVRLMHIFSRNQGEYCWLVCQKLLVEHFDTHYHAWKVRESSSALMSFNPKHLIYPLPLSMHCLDDGKYIAGLRYRL